MYDTAVVLFKEDTKGVVCLLAPLFPEDGQPEGGNHLALGALGYVPTALQMKMTKMQRTN